MLTIHAASRKGPSGFILVTTMLLGLVLTVTAATGFIVTRTQKKIAGNFDRTVRTFQASDSALQLGKKAIKDWLQAEQEDNELAYFTDILEDSAEQGDVLTVGGTSFKDLIYGDASYTLYLTNNEADIAGAGSSTVDTDRILKLVSKATGTKSPSSVTIETYIQSPAPESEGGTVKFPVMPGATNLCGDVKEQDVHLHNNTKIMGEIHNLPSWNCTGSSCIGALGGGVGRDGLVGKDALKHKVQLHDNATISGDPTGLKYDNTLDCTQMRNFANELAQLDKSLSWVDVIEDAIIQNKELGTPARPKVTILSGVNKKIGNVKGAGILMIHSEGEEEEMEIEIGRNFLYFGMIIIYGNAKTKYWMKKNSYVYGSVTILSGNDESETDPAEKYKLKMSKNAFIRYSSGGTRIAHRTVGGELTLTSEGELNDTAAGSVINISWREVY